MADPEFAAEEGKVRVKKAMLSRAVKALCQIVAKKTANTNPLFEANTETVQLQFTLSKVPDKRKTKPFIIELPHPMYNEKSEICFISKDPQKKYKDLLIRENPLPGLTKVIGVDKLRRNYKEFGDKAALADSFDLFLCDSAVAEMMPKLLGKMFYKNKRKLPVPVRFRMQDPHTNIKKAMNGTPLRIPQGPCLAIKIGRCSMDPQELEENAAVVIAKVVKHIADNPIMSICLQATDSPALPIWKRERLPGGLADLKKYRADNSSAASDTGASGVTSETENAGSEITSDAGETLSTRDSFSEAAISEIDTDLESASGLHSEGEEAQVAKQDLPLMQGLKKKKRKLGAAAAAGSAETPATASAAEKKEGSMAPPPPKKKKKAEKAS